MTNGKINNFLIPNVSKIAKQKVSKNISDKENVNKKNAFEKLLNDEIAQVKKDHGINLSNHAMKRLHERELDLDSGEYIKLKEAMNKLKDKGGSDSLVITEKAAYIVDVDNNTVVTAIDKNNVSENVFTKIDSTIFMNS